MRCKICNKNLNNQETILKDLKTGGFLDTCNKCLGVSYETLRGYDYSTEINSKESETKDNEF